MQANEQDAAPLLDRGLARLRLGKLQGAAEDFRRAADLDLSSADAQASLAYVLWLQGRLTEALAAARAALTLNPDHPSANYYAGRILLQTQSRSPEGLRHLERAVELSPEETGLRFDLMAAYRQHGELTRAALQLRLLRLSLPPDDARFIYAEGLLAGDLGHVSVAIERFRKALSLDPKLPGARQDLGVALVQAERWMEALEVLGPLAREQARSFHLAYFHALALHNAQRSAEAEVRRAVRLNPNSADVLTLLGIILASRGDYTEARAALENAVRLEPDNFDALFYLGRARYALRDLAGARAAFNEALKVRPEHADARFFLATTLEGLGETEAALSEYRRLTELRPKDSRGYLGSGSLLAKVGKHDKSLPALEQARKLDPVSFEVALALGRLHARMGNWQKAIPFLHEATELVPESAEAHYQLGLALQRVGRAEEAAREFAIVARLNEEHRSRSSGMGIAPRPPGGA